MECAAAHLDLFATKGLEYLFVLGFLGALVVFWRVLNRPARPVREAGGRPGRVSDVGDWFRLADGTFYHQGHTWAVPEGGDVVRVGLDDFAQKLIGRPATLDLPDVGDRVEQGHVGLSIGDPGKRVGVLSPVNGTVLAVNDAARRSPELVNEDPYGEGWLFKVRVPRLTVNLRNLLTGSVARAWMEETEEVLRDRMGRELGPAYQDGGTVLPGIARNLAPDRWDEIVAEFFLTDE